MYSALHSEADGGRDPDREQMSTREEEIREGIKHCETGHEEEEEETEEEAAETERRRCRVTVAK